MGREGLEPSTDGYESGWKASIEPNLAR
jgi:hypothetical protein